MGIDFDDVLQAVRLDPTFEVRLDIVTGSMVGLALVQAVEHAIDVANGEHGDPSDMHEDTWAESAQLSNDGASVVLVGWKDEDTLRSWLHVFAGELAAAGIAGTIRTTPVTVLPESYTGVVGPRPSAYVGFDGRVAAGERRAEEWCRRCAAWAAHAGGVGYLSRLAYAQLADGPDIGSRLCASILGAPVAPFAGLSYVGGLADMRHVSVGTSGQTVGQSWDSSHTSLDAVRELLVTLADLAYIGFVAMTPSWSNLWDSRRQARPPLPTVRGQDLRTRAELWDRFVPDAHVLQLLTERHLKRMHDLSTWQVSEVAAGRFLVEAADPKPWLRDGGLDDATVTRARTDFGRAIVSGDDPALGR